MRKCMRCETEMIENSLIKIEGVSYGINELPWIVAVTYVSKAN